MELLLLALLFPYLSWQLPHNSPSSKSIQRRAGPHSFDLSRVHSNTPGSEALHSDDLQDTERRSKYLIPVTVEGQTFQVELDTGSGDLWLIQSGFTCYSSHTANTFTFSNPTTQDKCNFGPTYTPGPGFEPEPDLNLLVEYGTGTRAVEGEMGYATVTLGDISVKQLIGAPINSSFPAYGDHIMSGIMGVGISSLTRSYDSEGYYHMYDSFMTSIFDAGYQPAQFSLALSRDDSKNGAGGIFTISGLPDNTSAVNIASSEPTTAKLQIFPPLNKTAQTFYAINTDNLVLGNETYDPNLLFYIDSGDPTLGVPSKTAAAINALWNPPIKSDGRTLSCDAVLTAPIGIAIGGRTYYMESRDLVGTDKNGICYSLVYASDGGVWNVLGDPFLKNVLAVFDWTYNSMEFYPRQFYES